LSAIGNRLALIGRGLIAQLLSDSRIADHAPDLGVAVDRCLLLIEELLDACYQVAR
jgi:hypothetical protein